MHGTEAPAAGAATFTQFVGGVIDGVIHGPTVPDDGSQPGTAEWAIRCLADPDFPGGREAWSLIAKERIRRLDERATRRIEANLKRAG